MKKVVEWCEYHAQAFIEAGNEEDEDDDPAEDPWEDRTPETIAWSREKFFLVDQEMLFELILAAHFLEIRSLEDDGCWVTAQMIKGKSAEETRRTFANANAASANVTNGNGTDKNGTNGASATNGGSEANGASTTNGASATNGATNGQLEGTVDEGSANGRTEVQVGNDSERPGSRPSNPAE